MQFDWWTFGLQTLNFAGLVWLLQRFLYKPMLRVIDARRAEVQQQNAAAAALAAKAKAALAEIEMQRVGIEAERAAVLKAAAAQAEEAATARRAQTERETAALLDAAHKGLAAERDAALAEARRAALDLGTDVARRLLAAVPLELRAQTWLEQIERHLASLTPVQRDELADGSNHNVALRVATAVPLSQPLMSEWRTRLGRALGDRACLEFEVDAALVAGAELHFPHAILRFSWSSALAAMRAEIESHDGAH